MSEYIVDFGDKGSAFVGLAMADAKAHGASIVEQIVRCIDCTRCEADEDGAVYCRYDGETIGRALDGLDGFCAWGERRDA